MQSLVPWIQRLLIQLGVLAPTLVPSVREPQLPIWAEGDEYEVTDDGLRHSRVPRDTHPPYGC
jgi:hypothetical protein